MVSTQAYRNRPLARKIINMQNFVGTKLYGNYGAMFPVVEMTVQSVDANGLATCIDDEGETLWLQIEDIRTERPENGSTIGVYLNEMHAY